MIPASTMAKLAALGLSPDDAAKVAEMLVEVEQATEAKAQSALEARRASDRERKARQRDRELHVKSRDVTGQDVTPRDTPSPDKEKSPTPPKEINPYPDDVGGEARVARDRRLERECRDAVVGLPVMTDPSFGPVLKLIDDPSLTEADVLEGIQRVIKTNHRLRFWTKLEPWVRAAARERLEAAMPPANYARAGPNGQTLTPFPSPESRNHAKASSPSDFLRNIIQSRADERDAEGPKLLRR